MTTVEPIPGRADRVLVTGASGFIGSHLTEALIRGGAEVTALVRYNSRNDWGHLEELEPEARRCLRVVAGDVRDGPFIRRLMKGRTLVFHLAALIGIPYSYEAASSYLETNAGGTLNVLQGALEGGVERLVHTSTSEVYGTARYVPIDESHPLQAQSPYAASKIAADKLAESFSASFGLPVVTVRPFNTYGPRQSARAVIPTITVQALQGDEVVLGNPDPIRDLTFVEDTVRGFLHAARSDLAVGRVVNLGTGKGIRIGDLATKIGTILGKRLNLTTAEERVRPAGSEVLRLVAANALARDILGWTPRVSLEEGLRRTAAWLRPHLGRYKANAYNV